MCCFNFYVGLISFSNDSLIQRINYNSQNMPFANKIFFSYFMSFDVFIEEIFIRVI